MKDYGRSFRRSIQQVSNGIIEQVIISKIGEAYPNGADNSKTSGPKHDDRVLAVTRRAI